MKEPNQSLIFDAMQNARMRQIIFRSARDPVVRFHAWFSTVHPVCASLVIVGAVLAIAALIYPVAAFIDAHLGVWVHVPQFEFRRWPFVLLAVGLSPLMETVIFQYLIFRFAYVSARLRQKGWLIVVFSAVFFGIQHFYSAGYVLISTCAGAAFSAGFLFAGTFKRGFWTVAFSHAIVNGVALAIKWIQ